MVITAFLGLSFFSRKHDVLVCIGLAAFLIVNSGFRVYGLDYMEYVSIIELISKEQVDDIESLMTVAKDPFFSAVVLASAIFSDDHTIALLVISVISVSTKCFLALTLPRYSSLFLGIYSIFLAPGLEFAAIRSGMAIGFLGLMLAASLSLRQRFFIAILATLSHISALVAIGLAPLLKIRRWDIFLLLLGIVGGGTYIALTYVDVISSLDSITKVNRSEEYLYDRGSLYNFFFPVASSIVFLMALLWRWAPNGKLEITAVPSSLVIALLLCATTFGAALPVSTYVIRILEFAWYFYLYGMVSLFAQNRPDVFRSGIVFWMVLVAYANIYRETWELMHPALFDNW